METLKQQQEPTHPSLHNKWWASVETRASLHSDICMGMERTYCFTTVCNETGGFLEGFLQVVFEPLILVLFGAQLHEFTWIKRTTEEIVHGEVRSIY